MRTRIVIILLISTVSINSLQAYQDKHSPIINIKIDNNSREQLAVSIDAIIPLETKEEFKIRLVSGIEYGNERIYVLDRWKKFLLAFDIQGNLTGKTSQGRAPGSVSEPYAFSINEEESTVLLYDQIKGPFFKYDHDLNYLSFNKVGAERIWMADYWFLEEDKMLVYYHRRNKNYTNGNQYFSYSLFKDNGAIKTELNLSFTGSKNSMPLRNGASVYKDEVLFVVPWHYKIYQLQGDETKVRYQLDFGEFNLTKEQRQTLSGSEIWNMMSAGKGIGLISGLWRTEKYIIITTKFRKGYYTFLYSPKDKKTFCLNDCFDAGTLPEFDVWGITKDGLLYGSIKPEEFIKFQKSSGKMKNIKVKESDNPIFIKIRI